MHSTCSKDEIVTRTLLKVKQGKRNINYYISNIKYMKCIVLTVSDLIIRTRANFQPFHLSFLSLL